MDIRDLYKKELTRVRRVAGAYKRYGADFGDLLKPVKRPTEGSIRRLAKIESEVRFIGEQSVRENSKDELLKRAKLAKDNFIKDIDGIENLGRKMRSMSMIERSRGFVKMVLDELYDELSDSRSLLGLKRFVNALEKVSGKLKGIMSRLVNAIYDDELNDPDSTPDQNSSKYIDVINDVVRGLGGAGSKYTIADLPW